VTKGVWCAYLDHVGPTDAVEWQETGIPKRLQDGEDAFIVRVDDLGAIPVVPDQENLDKLTGDAAAGVAAIAGYFVVAVDGTSARMFYSFPREGVRRVIPYTTVDLTDDPGGRLAACYEVLAQKRIGIVGGGSLGSKIAVSLARSGVGAFVIVDDDILKPGNLVRHDLDAASLGAHKVEALAERLRRVSPTVAVSARQVVLGGQESSGSTASVLDELATCDLVIDATGDPLAFNLVASVARNALRPMVWAEVYAGGIGGFVARVRPDIEPPPHAARRQYLSWCEQQGVPWVHQDADYGRRGEAVAPLVADDADVMAIAAHACRMAVDALVRPDGSLFPHPAYVIGLAAEWLFSEPFDTRPVDFVAEGPWRTITPVRTTEAIEFMTSLFDTGEDDDATRRTGT
jgi:sulfur-carrier protein adenylyltransferase/sulfurtransferase